ncbi:MAG: hypothetical protein ABSB40_12050 [Nitrososphaeria archaeon]|jgi:hypothetical protein
MATKYVMNGTINSPPYTKITWQVWNTPDMTGALSGVSNLTNIFVDYTVNDDVVAGGNEQVAQVPPPTPEQNAVTPKVWYVMKALCSATTPANGLITWKVANDPDLTGQYSGFETDTLSNIVIDYTINDSVTSGPQAVPDYQLIYGAASGDLTGVYPDPIVVAIQGQSISRVPPSSGQVLEWNGTNWIPTALPTALPPDGSAGGDLSGTYPNPTVAKLQGNTLSASSPRPGQLLGFNGSAWVPEAAPVTFTAGGDLSGNNSSQTVIGIQGKSISSTSPTDGYVLTWSAATSKWAPAAVTTGTTTLGGDVTGISSANTVIKLQGIVVKSGTPTDGYVLTYSTADSQWEPKSAPIGFTAGGDLSGTNSSQEVTGILNKSLPSLPVSDGYLNYTGSAWTFSPIIMPTSLPPNGSAGGDLSGSYPNPTVAKINGHAVASTSPTDGYLLTWSAADSQWEPKTAPTPFTAGGDLSGTNTSQTVAGIQGQTLPALPVSDGYLNYTGSAWQYSTITIPTTLPPSGAAGGDLSGTYPNPTVAQVNGHPISYYIPTSLPPNGSAGGDLSGTYPNPKVTQLDGYAITPLATGYLNWTGSAMAWTALPSALPPNGNAGGNLSGTYPNPTISSLAVSKLAAGNAGQILLSNGSPNPTWITVIGDVTISSSGVTTVAKIYNTSVSSTAPTDGYILQYHSSGTQWAPTKITGDVTISNAGATTLAAIDGHTLPSPSGSNTVLTYNSGSLSWGAGGSGITALTGDVTASGSGSVSATVAAISGSSPIAITPNVLSWAAASTAPEITQTAAASTSGGNGAAGINLTIQAQAGQSAAGTGNNGGAGGNIILQPGAGGASLYATVGSAGYVEVVNETLFLPQTYGSITYGSVNSQLLTLQTTSGAYSSITVLTLPLPGTSGAPCTKGVLYVDICVAMASTTTAVGATIKACGGWAVVSAGSPTAMGVTNLLNIGTNSGAPPSGWAATMALDGGSNNVLVKVTGDSSLTVDCTIQVDWRYVK